MLLSTEFVDRLDRKGVEDLLEAECGVLEKLNKAIEVSLANQTKLVYRLNKLKRETGEL